MRRATRPCACALLLALLGLHAAAFRFRSPPPISARGLHLGTTRPAAVVRVPARLGRRPIICLGRAAPADVATHLVWYTGCADLRIHDHGGLIAAASSGARCIPVFVLDDQLHLEMPENLLRRLHGALVGLDNDLASAYGGRLIYREGDSSRLLVELAKESKATVVHVLADEITYSLSAQRRATRAALDKAGVEVRATRVGRARGGDGGRALACSRLRAAPRAPAWCGCRWAAEAAAGRHLPATSCLPAACPLFALPLLTPCPSQPPPANGRAVY